MQRVAKARKSKSRFPFFCPFSSSMPSENVKIMGRKNDGFYFEKPSRRARGRLKIFHRLGRSSKCSLSSCSRLREHGYVLSPFSNPHLYGSNAATPNEPLFTSERYSNYLRLHFTPFALLLTPYRTLSPLLDHFHSNVPFSRPIFYIHYSSLQFSPLGK